jgi:GT2 family glycosyltransferase
LFLNPDTKDPAQQIERFYALKQQYGANLMTIKQNDGQGKIKKVFDIFPNAFNSLGPLRAALRLYNPQKYGNARHCTDSYKDVDWISGSALMITAVDFKHLGGFSEKFWMYSEDVDLCFRASKLGLKVGFSADACIEHRHGGSSRINLTTTALTKSEVVISKHVYANRNFNGLHAALYHLFLLVFRFVPCILFKLLDLLLPKTPKLVKIGALKFQLIGLFYQNGFSGKGWQSIRTSDFNK